MLERLQKVLARSGVASRRKAEELIAAGRVEVNGRRVTELGTRVDSAHDTIRVDDRQVADIADRVYFVLFKPSGCVTTLQDPEGRATVADWLRAVPERVFPVGRLDFDAEGALLLTNDGTLAHKLMHPKFGAKRTYLAKVKGVPEPDVLHRLQEGVQLDDGFARPVDASFVSHADRNTWIRLVVAEGRPHLVKRMCEAVGHPVQRLFRAEYAGVNVEGMMPGELRELSAAEVKRLRTGDFQGAQAPALPPRRDARRGERHAPTARATKESGASTGQGADVGSGGGARGPHPPSPSPHGPRRNAPVPQSVRAGGEGGKSGRTFGARKSFGDKAGRSSGDRKPAFGERKSFGDKGKRPFGDRKPAFGERKSFGDKAGRSFGDRKPAFGERKSFGDKAGRSFGDRKPAFGERKSFGDKAGRSFGDRKPAFGERKSFGDKSGRPFGDRKPAFGERKSFGDKAGRPFGDRKPGFGERKPFGDKAGRSFGDRKPAFGERKSFGDKAGRSSGDRKSAFGERKSFGDKGKRSFGDRKPSFGGRKSFGDKGKRSTAPSRRHDRGTGAFPKAERRKPKAGS